MTIEVEDGDVLIRRVVNGWFVRQYEQEGFEGSPPSHGSPFRVCCTVFADDPEAADGTNPEAHSWLAMMRQAFPDVWRWKRTAGIEAQYHATGRGE